MGIFNVKKTQKQFKDELKEVHPEIEVIGEYIKIHCPILFKYKNHLHKMSPASMLRGSKPTIKSAVNKTEHWIERAIAIHGNKYDYSKVEYKKGQKRVTIICPEHGEFRQKADKHLQKRGCPKCGIHGSSWSSRSWEAKAEKSKNFTGFKLYIIECWSEETDERFYKIGKTFRDIDHRFENKEKMPYNYDILTIIGNSAKSICKLEKKLHKINTKYRYTPNIEFGGSSQECFTKIEE